MTTLPRDILDRSERVLEFHHHTRWAERAVPATVRRPLLAAARVMFPSCPKVALPTNLLDLPVSTLQLMQQLSDALPESMRDPPQNARTLATWLFMAAGVTWPKKGAGVEVRAWPSAYWTYPCELYLAVFGIDGIDPGFYHFSPAEFALRKLREATDALSLIKRGRPDLEFLKTVPAAMLVSTSLARASHRFERRGYRFGAVEAGQLTENLAKVGSALGVRTLTRLRLTDSSMRELLGLDDQTAFADEQVVHAMVVWADAARAPLVSAARTAGALPAIAREHDAPTDAYGSILAAHQDCVAPGVAVREIRPPLTNLSPLPSELSRIDRRPLGDAAGGQALSRVLMKHTFAQQFTRLPCSRDAFLHINRLAFRGGAYYPLVPDDSHVGCIRPFWIVHDVVGLDAGIWAYDVMKDQWADLNRGGYRLESSYLSLEDAHVADAAAVCIMVANLRQLLSQGGPDTYRLALVEAGICTQRAHLAASAMGFGVRSLPAFYDEAVRRFLGIEHTGWEPLQLLALGTPPNAKASPLASTGASGELGFRD